jgi:hypothetical protein
MAESYQRNSYNRVNKSSTSIDEIADDLKNDLLLAFNLYKNEENKINKLKMRTLLFSFAMYKSSPKQINDFISEIFPKQEEFTYDDLLKLISFKLKNIKDIEAESLFNIINPGKTQNFLSKQEISKGFESNMIEISEREINEMMQFMTNSDKSPEEVLITKDEFKKFLV